MPSPSLSAEPPPGASRGATLLANGLVLATLALAAVLNRVSPASYDSAVQEDEWLEWATFWAFAFAAAAFARIGLRQRAVGGRMGWFSLLVAAFCAVVALEEISWGQRLLGFTPPDYFLEHNYQQELNLHNVFSSTLRLAALRLAVLGYGVALPLLALAPVARNRLSRLGLRGAPLGLMPAFLATYVMVEAYPWRYSGEVAELMFGLALLGGGLLSAPAATGRRPARTLAAAAVVVFLLGLGSARWLRGRRAGDAAAVEAARRELAALGDDLGTLAAQRGGEPVTRCGLHKRLHTFVTEYGVDGLRRGEFARLSGDGVPRARAKFFLDPWNLPYWVKDECERGGRRHVFVYSFGPNRRRDATDWEPRPDDVGVFVLRRAP